jgi:DNA gyrase subunit B
VDGAHIRTLLLTFFFRHMVPVIEAGHLFIAQPPLFKVKKGKAERYLMSEREMEEFLLSHWVEKASVKIPGKAAPLREEPLLETLRRTLEFRQVFHKFVRKGLPAPIIDGLLRARFRATKRGVGPEQVGAAIQAVVSDMKTRNLRVELREGDNGDGGILEVTGDLPARISPETLRSPDYETLYELYEKVPPLHKGPALIVDANGKEVSVKSLDELLRVVMDLAKDGATLQRYKGLGEMNPEQLWETTMNPQTRTLLKVTMEDAVGADEMFTVLMGDAVEPRREFIERNALDVVNLDV